MQTLEELQYGPIWKNDQGRSHPSCTQSISGRNLCPLVAKLTTKVYSQSPVTSIFAPTFLTFTLPLGYPYLHYLQDSSYTRVTCVTMLSECSEWVNKVLWKCDLLPFLFRF